VPPGSLPTMPELLFPRKTMGSLRRKAHNILDRASGETKEDFNALTLDGLSDQCTPFNLSHLTPPKSPPLREGADIPHHLMDAATVCMYPRHKAQSNPTWTGCQTAQN
jgi:hypothetical protein